ncbi:MAG: Rab family GTPase [Candidatus Hodarchaeales archaeon]
MEENELNQVIFKLVLLGEGTVGKTSLRHRYLGKEFSTSYLATLGADFAIREVPYENKFIVRYQIWDLAGQPRFNSLRKSFYIGAQGALVLYDITNRHTLDAVSNWTSEFFQNNGKGVQPIVLIGNKIDLRNETPDTITFEEGNEVAQKLASESETIVPFIETSAKTGENISKAFEIITDYFFKIRFKS